MISSRSDPALLSVPIVRVDAYVDDEVVMMDRQGHFDGSKDAAGYVEITIPGLTGRHIPISVRQCAKPTQHCVRRLGRTTTSCTLDQRPTCVARRPNNRGICWCPAS